MQQPYKPRVGDFRISKEVVDGKRWVWRFELDGTWQFITSLTELQAGDFVANKNFIQASDKYDYWR